MGGQARIRVRYHKYTSPYFDYLMVSKDELGRIVRGSGWKIAGFVRSKGSLYIAVLERNPA
jgi:hypothetical protein